LDFADLRTDSKDGAWMTVMNVKGDAPVPDEKGNPIKFRIAGSDSEYGLKAIVKYREARAAIKGEPTPQQDIELNATLLSNVILEWTYMKFEGEVLPCTKENSYRILSVPGLAWLRSQAQVFFWTPSNFIQPSQTKN
jgi:hypothetical protein